MNIRSTILLFLLPLAGQAQIEKWIAPKHIIWAAKVEAIASFDIIKGTLPNGLLETVPVKAIQEMPEAPKLQPFNQKLFQLIEQGAFPAYADKNLQRPLSLTEARACMSHTDTIIVFDPETYEEKIHIISNELLGESPLFLTQQLWLYNGSKNQLKTIVLAIAPAVEDKGQPGQYQPLVWFQLPSPQNRFFKLQSSSVQFATYVRYNVSEEKMEVVKGKDRNLKEILVEQFKSGGLTCYDLQRRPIDPSEIDDIFIHQDTIVSFDPETYEEMVQVARTELNTLDITDFRVQQHWFFAPSRIVLQCKLLALAPTVPIVDEYGNHLALRPLFFWRQE